MAVGEEGRAGFFASGAGRFGDCRVAVLVGLGCVVLVLMRPLAVLMNSIMWFAWKWVGLCALVLSISGCGPVCKRSCDSDSDCGSELECVDFLFSSGTCLPSECDRCVLGCRVDKEAGCEFQECT